MEEDSCYGRYQCQFFSFDTFGGPIQILRNFSSVHMSGVELKKTKKPWGNKSWAVTQCICTWLRMWMREEDMNTQSPGYHHCFSGCVAICGTLDVGMWCLLHWVPTGQSEGRYPEGQAEHTLLGVLYHSSSKAGLFIGKGVKTTRANAEDPREHLTVDNARFCPH